MNSKKTKIILSINSNTFFTKFKKGISPVVATALLLVIAVVAVVGFQGWFQTFQSEMFVKTEQESSSTSQIGIETLVGNSLYVKGNINTTIDKITIDGQECSFTGNITGVQNIDVSDCIISLTTSTPEIVVQTKDKILSKKVFISNSVFNNNLNSNKADIECYEAPANTIGLWDGCRDMLIVNRSMLINAQWVLPSKSDRYITFNGINYTFGDNEYNIFTGQITDLSGDYDDWTSLILADSWNDYYSGNGFNANIDYWDVSNVKNMSLLFSPIDVFNQNLSSWDVSNVIDMTGMFGDAENFNGDLSNWDVSNVKNMEYMFSGCTNFNGDLSNWDVSNVKNMSYMFAYNNNFNSDLSSWDVSLVTDMEWMFYRATNFNSDLSSWDVSNVKNMYEMFHEATNFNSDLSSWDVSNVMNMHGMFAYCSNFSSNLSNWNVSSVTDMGWMFGRSTNFNSNLSNWDVSSVTDMGYMFYYASNFNSDLNSWNVSQVTYYNAFDFEANSWVLPKPNFS